MNIQDVSIGLIFGLLIAAVIWRVYMQELKYSKQLLELLTQERDLYRERCAHYVHDLENVAAMLPKLEKPTKPQSNWNNPPEGVNHANS